MPNPAIGSIACPTCDLDAQVRETAKHKPYIVCDDCGFQGFARGQGAVAKLLARMTPIAAPVAPTEPQPQPEETAMAAPKKKAPARKPATPPKKPRAPAAPKADDETPPPPKKPAGDDFGNWLGL